MPDVPRALIIGEDPRFVDFSDPAIPPGMTAEKVLAGLKEARDALVTEGWSAEILLTDMAPDAAARAVAERLATRRFDVVSVGAGLRIVPKQTVLFEAVMNAVHAGAPAARLAFSTRPGDTAEAIKRAAGPG